MNQVVELPKAGIVPSAGRMSVAEVTQHAIAVQEVMKAVMKEGVHYGVIPGTKKPTLYKAGSEMLLTMFQIGTTVDVIDLSSEDRIKYRVIVTGMHTPNPVSASTPVSGIWPMYMRSTTL